MHTDPVFEITEIFRSIQGEGIDAGSPAVFVRLSGCNLSCGFCDTDHNKREVLVGSDLIKRIVESSQGTRLIVFTGGEPLLQPVINIIPQLKSFGFHIGVETNGTVEADPTRFNSLSLSPKVKFEHCKIPRCHSLKILYPYLNNITPESYKTMYAGYRFIQPIWVDDDEQLTQKNIREAAEEVMKLGDGWKLGLQIHKFAGLE